MPLSVEKLNSLLGKKGIETFATHGNTKASEEYVDLKIADSESAYVWNGTIPVKYRRTGLSLETEEEVVKYLLDIRKFFKPNLIKQWVRQEKRYWGTRLKADVTKAFFDALAKLKWVNPEDFPINPNPQRRLQDIKELGYTIASKKVGRGYARLLVPIPRAHNTGYEQISKNLKECILRALEGTNVYEISSANKAGLIPDHKFPEIRWDKDTASENLSTMSEEEIRDKFQLIDNQRNQQKREVCRRCCQTGKRGIIFGIKYFYSGDENWPNDVPKAGKGAEKGCIGCGWYDIAVWRKSLNKRVS